MTDHSKSRESEQEFLCMFETGMHGKTCIYVTDHNSFGAGTVNQINTVHIRSVTCAKIRIYLGKQYTSPKYVFAQT